MHYSLFKQHLEQLEEIEFCYEFVKKNQSFIGALSMVTGIPRTYTSPIPGIGGPHLRLENKVKQID